MIFSGFISTMKQCAKDLNTLAQKMANEAKTKFGPTVDKVKDGIDVVKAGADVVSTVVSDVTGDNVTIRSIQKGAADFDKKWDAFAKEINDKFNAASPSGKADILENFVKSKFGDDIFNLGSAIKNELPGVLDGLADYKEVVDTFGVEAKTVEEKAKKIQSGADKIIKATEKVAGSLNEAVKTCTGKGYPVLDQLSKIGGTAAVDNLNKALNLGVAGATTATAVNELKNAVKGGDLRGITDAMAKGATSINDLLSQLNTLVPGFPKAQIPAQITTSIKRLQDGQAVYDAARSTLTALVADASGPMTVASLATLTSHFDKNWDNFSDKIDALFQVTPGKGQQAVLETVAKSMVGENVFYAGGAIKRQLPGVLTGVAGVQEAINTFGGSYRDPIEAATKIRIGVEKMVQSVEKISQSLNNMVKFYQGKGDISKGTGYPLLDTLGKLGDTKGIKALDTALRIGGGAAAVVGNAGALSEAIKNKDIKGTVAAAKKTIDDIKKLTKKGEYKADKLTIGNTSGSGNGGNTGKAANAQNNQQQQNQNNNNQKQLSSAATNSYVCSGATMRCTMGTSQASLTVLPIRTVNLTGKPMANISDHLSFVNLGQFGRCRSLGFPATAAATAAAHGKLTPMPCVHNTPFPWMGGKNDYIIKGDPALLKSSKCQCMWGGTISLVNDGQTYTGPADLSKRSTEEFEKNQSSTKGLTSDDILDGIQMALDVAGFIPGLGAVPDLLNAAISACRGDWVGAGMSILSAVPGIGDAAAAAKIAKKGANAAKTIGKSEKAIKTAKTISKEEKKAIAKKYISKDVTKEELLKEKGVTPENVDEVFRQVKIERKREAINFYKEHIEATKEDRKLITEYSEEAFKQAKKEAKTQKEIEEVAEKVRKNRQRIVSEINGIDFNKKVERVTIKKGDVLYQHSSKDLSKNVEGIGNYATENINQTPSQSGISKVGGGRIKNQYEIKFGDIGDDGIPALKSTTKEITDTWSQKLYLPNDPVGKPSHIVPAHADGGGTQYWIPDITKKEIYKKLEIRQSSLQL